MKQMSGTTFRAHCSAVLNDVRCKRDAVIITKRGKPIAKLIALDAHEDDFFGFMVGKGSVATSISPVLTPEEWGDLY